MASDKTPDEPDKQTMKADWGSGSSGTASEPLFTPDEIDIYVNKVTLEAYFFHGKEIDYSQIDHVEYHPNDYTVDIVRKDGTRQDLGVKIQWLVRPYLTKASEINIVRTKDGESIDGHIVPLVQKDKT